MKNIVILFFIFSANLAVAQSYKLSGLITNEKKSPLANVTIEYQDKKALSNANGHYELLLNKGRYNITFKHLGYKSISKTITIQENRVLNIQFNNATQDIEEVYVTAQEGKSLSTSSVITKDAMQLLQPSSFTDLLELLPGGRAQDPNLTSFNPIKIREVNLKGKTITLDKYDMSSLGVAFYMDGAPINTNSDLQSLENYTTSTNSSIRENTNRGLDLRALGTDDIEKVTIVRGIPSVEYGDLTSGLVLIERKKGESKYNIRAKTDGFGKLFALSKGYALKKDLLINYDLGYTLANSNPTNSFENFSRFSGSVRIDKTWDKNNRYNFQSILDYNTTLDNKKTDPDNSYLLDKYYSRNQRWGINNQFSIDFKNKQWIEKLKVISSFSLKKDIIDEDKWIQARTATILINSLEEGSHEAQFLTPSYLSKMYVEGLPFTSYTKVVTDHRFKINTVNNFIKLGVENNYSKNYGKGQVYDLNYPAIINTTSTARPRAFKDIPGFNTVSAFAEENIMWNINKIKIDASLGIRASAITSLSKEYSIANKIFTEPRANLRVSLPQFNIDNKPISIIIGAGYGIQKKTPTLDHLYPNLEYRDIVELNFYHDNPAFRIAQAHTTITNPTNYQIKPASNYKKEANTDIEFDGNRLSLTLFKERMIDGFRPYSMERIISYKAYDNKSLDISNLNQKPTIGDFDYKARNEYYNYTITENGSQILKNGLEFQLTTKRFQGINTRFTVYGAYYKTEYSNSIPIWSLDQSIVHNNQTRQVQAKYLNDDGYIREMLNSNFTVDSHLPSLGLNLSASFQALWFTASQNLYKSGTPISYKFVDDDIEMPFTAASAEDPTLKQLIKTYTANNFLRNKEPLDLQINLKASKNIKSLIKASVFVNRLFLYRPNYTSALGTQISRALDTPYFGMEITLSL